MGTPAFKAVCRGFSEEDATFYIAAIITAPSFVV
jgi:hypothetical protein